MGMRLGRTEGSQRVLTGPRTGGVRSRVGVGGGGHSTAERRCGKEGAPVLGDRGAR